MPKPTCSVPDCQSPSSYRGWCTKHYQRWLKYGDPTAMTLTEGQEVDYEVEEAPDGRMRASRVEQLT